MSVSDFFKPIWKNSNSEVRLKHLIHISETTNYKKGDPNTIKIIKNLAIHDSDERIVNKAISLLQEPEDFKEILNSAKTAAIRAAMTKEIEKKFQDKIKEINTSKLKKFISIFKNEQLIKEIIFYKTELLEEGLTKITLEEIFEEIFSFCIKHQNNEENLTLLIDRAETSAVLKKMLLEYQKSDHPIPSVIQYFKKKILKVSTPQEISQELEQKQRLEKFSSLLNETLHLVKERIHTQNFSVMPMTTTIDYFYQEWDDLKNFPELTETTTEEYEKKLEDLKQSLNEWEELKVQYDYTCSLASQLVEITQNFDKIVPQEDGLTHLDLWESTLVEEFINQLKKQVDETDSKAHQLIHNIPEAMHSLPVISNSRDEYIAKKNYISSRLKKIHEQLLQQAESFQKSQGQLNEIINAIKTFLQSCDKEQESNTDTLNQKLSKYKSQWEEMFHKVTQSLPSSKFYEQRNSFEELLSQATQKINQLIQEKAIQHDQFIKQLSQEIKTKTTEVVTVIEALEEDPKSSYQDSKNKLIGFSKAFELYQKELPPEQVKEYQTKINALEKKLKEIQENIYREHSINLSNRQKICSILEEVASLEDKEKLVTLVKEAQLKWRKAGQISKKDFTTINQYFENICKKILEDCGDAVKVIEEKIQNEVNRKKNLITKIEDINSQTSNYDIVEWKKISTTVNEIISEWKKIKILSEKDNRELNIDFKNSLNNFYKKHNDYFSSLKQKMGEKLEQKNSLLKEILLLKEEVTSSKNQSTEWKSFRQKLLEFNSKWHKLGVIYPYSQNKDLNNNFYTVYEEILSLHNEDMETRKQQKENLFSEITGIEKSLEGKNDSSNDIKEMQESVEKIFVIKNKWDKVAPIATKNIWKLNNEFHKIYKKLLNNNKSVIEEINKNKKDNLEKKQHLLEQLEKILEKKSEQNIVKEIIELQQKWKEVGPIPSKMYFTIESPFFKKISLFFKERRNTYKEIKNQQQKNYEKKQAIINHIRALLHSNKSHESNANDLIKSPEQLKMIWEMNRQMRSKGEQSNQRKIRNEIKILKNQWYEIGPAHSEKKLNDEFYTLLKNIK